jgi:hypothetical protein
MAVEQDEHIAEVVTREQSRLRDFIRRRVPIRATPRTFSTNWSKRTGC